MDFINLGMEKTRDGLALMMNAALNEPEESGHYIDYPRFVEIQEALLIIEIAKRAEDKAEWFPHGKWATIQALENRVGEELGKLFK